MVNVAAVGMEDAVAGDEAAGDGEAHISGRASAKSSAPTAMAVVAFIELRIEGRQREADEENRCLPDGRGLKL